MKQLQLTRMEKAQHRIMAIIYWFSDAFSWEKKKEFYKLLIEDLKKELKK